MCKGFQSLVILAAPPPTDPEKSLAKADLPFHSLGLPGTMSSTQRMESGNEAEEPATRFSQTYVALCCSIGCGSLGYVASGSAAAPSHTPYQRTSTCGFAGSL